MRIIQLIFISVFLIDTHFTSLTAQNATPKYLASVNKELNAVWPNNRTINIVFHGHSVVAGYQDKHQVHTFESYPILVLKKLKERFPYAVINVMVTAVGGENSKKGQERFEQDVIQKRPDLVFIDYALNDIALGLDESKRYWERMVRSAVGKGIKVVLITPSPDQRIDIIKPGNELELHSEQIRLLAKKYQVGLADPFLRFQELIRGGEDIKNYMSHVNHPNIWGNLIITNEIMELFK